MVNVLSFGAGVNSTAILAMMKQGKVEIDTAVFADTGCEFPETYQYIENSIKPLCDELGVRFYTTCRNPEKNLYQEYFENKIIPTRMYRHCTDKFKIQPLKKFIIQKFPSEPVNFVIGIDAGEAHRAKAFCSSGNALFPLIEWGMNRRKCKQIIKQVGLPVPMKSGCTFCPFTKKRGWMYLYQYHLDKYNEAITLEQNCSRYPEITLSSKPLIDMIPDLQAMIKDKKATSTMCEFMPSCPLCEVGYDD